MRCGERPEITPVIEGQTLSAEDIADTLGIARSNVSNSLRELQIWNIIRSVPILGDRRTFYTAETDLWNLMSRIGAGRKTRELDPAAAALRECVEMSRDDKRVDPVVQLRLREMLDFVECTSRWYEQMIALPRSTNNAHQAKRRDCAADRSAWKEEAEFFLKRNENIAER